MEPILAASSTVSGSASAVHQRFELGARSRPPPETAGGGRSDAAWSASAGARARWPPRRAPGRSRGRGRAPPMDDPEPEWHGPGVLAWIRGARRFRRWVLATAALSIAGLGSCAATRERDDLDARRLALVRSIEANGVQDSTTLSAM